jgi:acetyl-CoA carboxylase biotin carboxylase subunit
LACASIARSTLGEIVVTGVQTTVPLFQDLVSQADIVNGDYHIHWLEQYLEDKG